MNMNICVQRMIDRDYFCTKAHCDINPVKLFMPDLSFLPTVRKCLILPDIPLILAKAHFEMTLMLNCLVYTCLFENAHSLLSRITS